ncbi:MAG: magnesium transporter [Mucilaginibacter sp.]|nr:magnesium transporter [Mucilaginibacter sp.]
MINLTLLKDKLLQNKLITLLSGKDKESIHPAEVAHMMNNSPLKTAEDTFMGLPDHAQLLLFNYLASYLQKSMIEKMPQEKAAALLNHLNSTDRYTFYASLNGVQRSALLELLDEKNKKATEDMLGYPRQSVARLVNTSFCTLNQEMTLAQASHHLRLHHEDSDAADVVYVTDNDGKLIDDIPIRKLVLNDGSKTVHDIMDHHYVKLMIDDSTDEAISRFKQYNRTVLPVTNAENVLLGVVTIDDLIDVAEQRNTKEMQRFGGVESLEYPYVKTPLFSLIRKRAGWLIILFLSEMLTATAMGYFEGEIAKAVVLALFVPLVISSGGNCGSQAATLIIRAMAVRELRVKDWWYVMRREILSGLILGIILGTIGFLRIVAWQHLHWYNYGPDYLLMGITIFFSLIGIVMWGTLSGSMIPILLKRLKFDPATSSAPFVATLVDVTGLVIYFSIAAIILRDTLLK